MFWMTLWFMKLDCHLWNFSIHFNDSFYKNKSKTNARQNMKTTRNKKPRFLKHFGWRRKFASLGVKQFRKFLLIMDDGCFVFINCLSKELAQYFVINVCSLVLFHQKMGDKTLMFGDIFLSNFPTLLWLSFIISHHFLEFELLKTFNNLMTFLVKKSCPIFCPFVFTFLHALSILTLFSCLLKPLS